jgi:hypothetical protein
MGRSMHDTIYVQKKKSSPEIEHFRFFGCPMYFHVPKEKKSKLHPLGIKDILNLQRHSKSEID